MFSIVCEHPCRETALRVSKYITSLLRRRTGPALDTTASAIPSIISMGWVDAVLGVDVRLSFVCG